MVKQPPYQFRVRSGNTPLPDDWRQDLLRAYQTISVCSELDIIEDANILEGLAWLATQRKFDPMVPGGWLHLHRKLFSQVWSWAGKYKRRDHANTEFVSKADAPNQTAELSKSLAYWIESPGIGEKKAAAFFHERFLTIHPFQNGNGRTARIVTELVCKQLKWTVPTWNEASLSDPQKRRREYVDAVVLARTGDHRQLIAVMFR